MLHCPDDTPGGALPLDALESLLAVCREERPDVVVLLGPFVDLQHPLVAHGDCDDYDQVFSEVVDLLRLTLDADLPSTRVLLLPSLRDVHHPHPLLPQPPLSLPCPHPRLHCFPNPSFFRLNEVVCAALSEDLLFALSATFISTPSEDRFARILEQLLRQRSFAPISPTPKGYNVSASRLDALDFPAMLPDVLFLASDLRFFVKRVCGVLCVNLGRLVKGVSNGTYTALRIRPFDHDLLDQAIDIDHTKPIPHHILDRAHVEMRRI